MILVEKNPFTNNTDINNAKNVCFRKINSPFVNYKYTTFI